jgi:transposase
VCLLSHHKDTKPLRSQRNSKKNTWKCSRVGVHKFLHTFEETGSILRRVGSGRPSKVTAEIKQIVEEQMRKDDETTAYQLHQLLSEKGYSISLRTILRCRTTLGWTFRGSAYCQLIRDANKVKRLQWTQEHRDDSFDDVIWTDECTVQMESHRRFACRKRGEAPRPKPR